MINFTLLKKEFKSNISILITFMSILSMYGIVMISMFDPKLGESLKLMYENMSEMFALFGMNNFSSNSMDFLINIKYIDRGIIVYLLATPNSRIKIISTQILNGILEIFLLNIYITILYIIVSEAMFKGELDIIKLIIINIGLFSLWFAFLGICFLSSVIFNSSSVSLWAGSGFCMISILLQMISRVGDKAEIFKYFSLITLFSPYKYSTDFNLFLLGSISLFVMAIITYILTIFIFNKRDISV